MKRLAQIAALVVVALLSSCSNKEIALSLEPLYTPRYAKGFSIERDTERDNFLSSAEALEYGLIDKVVDKRI